MGVNAFLNTIFLFNLNSYHAQNLYRGLAYLLKSTVGEVASISLTSKSYCLLEKQFDSKKYHWLRTNLVRKKMKKKNPKLICWNTLEHVVEVKITSAKNR